MGEALCSQEGRHIPVAVSERQERTIDSTNDEYGLETHRTLTRFRVYNFRFHTPPSQNRESVYSNDNVRYLVGRDQASGRVGRYIGRESYLRHHLFASINIGTLSENKINQFSGASLSSTAPRERSGVGILVATAALSQLREWRLRRACSLSLVSGLLH